MLHSYVKLWVHLVWATKGREKRFSIHNGQSMYNFLMQKSLEIGIPFERVNVQPEHIHGLIDLPSNACLSDFMHMIKGSSSRWANKTKLFNDPFSWQRGYGGLSVSCRHVSRVSNYIKYQSKHHKTYTFSDEYEEWQKEYGIFDD